MYPVLSSNQPKLHMAALSVFALIFALGMVQAPGNAFAVEKETIDGVLHIQNGPTPVGVETLELEELWTAGGEDDEDVLFGIITMVKIDANNNIYLLDNQMSQVYVYSSEGELLNTLGRAGEGPGEVSNPAGMILLDDGSIGLLKLMPATLVIIDKEGIPVDNYSPGGDAAADGGLVVAFNCFQGAENFIFGTVKISMDNATLTQTRTYSIDSYGADTNALVRYNEKEVIWAFNDNFVMREIDTDYAGQRMDVADNGQVFIAIDRNKYEFNSYNVDGTLDRIVHRQHEPLPRSQEMKDLLDRAFAMQMRQLPPGSSYEYEPNEGEVQSLRVAGDGTIWVQHSQQVWDPEPGVFSYDVFNPEGEFILEKRFICPGSARNDRLFFTDSGQVIKITGFLEAAISAQGLGADDGEEAEPMSVTCYKIK